MSASWGQGLAKPELWWLAKLPANARTRVIELLWEPQAGYFGIPYGKLGLIRIRSATSPMRQNVVPPRTVRPTGPRSRRVGTPTSGRSGTRYVQITYSSWVTLPFGLSLESRGSLRIGGLRIKSEVPQSLRLFTRRTSFGHLIMDLHIEPISRSSLGLSEVRAQVRSQRLESR
jgi:hypothetical protein